MLHLFGVEIAYWHGSQASRIIQGNCVYHILKSKGSGRSDIFRKDADYGAFLKILGEGRERFPIRILAYVLMPNHFHLVLWPNRMQGEMLSDFMRWVQVTHTQRYHAHHGTSGSGHVYQGRFKSFPVQSDVHLRTVCRYVERNPLRAGLVKRAELWRWSSLFERVEVEAAGRGLLAEWPERTGLDIAKWVELVNRVQTGAELKGLEESMKRGRPFGDGEWVAETAKAQELGASMNPRGRPRKTVGEEEKKDS